MERKIYSSFTEQGITWNLLHPKMTREMLGHIPFFLSEEDPNGAVQQLDFNYRHDGGWQDFQGFKMLPDGSLQYPQDPPYPVLAEAQLRDETILFYPHSWIAVIQADGTFRISRMD